MLLHEMERRALVVCRGHGAAVAMASVSASASQRRCFVRAAAPPHMIGASQQLHTSCSAPNSSSSEDNYHRHQQQHKEEAAERAERRVLGAALREAQVAEAALSGFFAGQAACLRGRPDAAFFAERERRHLAAVQALMPRHRARPSLLLGAARAAAAAAGALAAAAPPALRGAAAAALQDAATEAFNGQLAELRRRGLSDKHPDVRALLLSLRDLERAPEGAPPPPDLIAVYSSAQPGGGGVGAAGVAGAAVKAAALAVLEASKRL